MRRLQLHRRSLSMQSQGSNTEDQSTVASTGPSATSGSMDSYVSQGTDATSHSEDSVNFKDVWGGGVTASPRNTADAELKNEDHEEGERSPRTERNPSVDRHLSPIQTAGGDGEDEPMMSDSPTSDKQSTPVKESAQ